MSADCLAEIQGTTKDLLEFEKVIEKGLQTFAEVGSALIAIRERRLYLLSHRTFEDYLLDRWDLKQSRAYQLMDAAATIGNLKQSSTIVELPQNESQCRPLVQLPPEQQAEAWAEAVETAPNGKVTAAHVAQTVDRITHPIEEKFSQVEDIALPSIEELRSLYEQIGNVEPHREGKGFAVTRPDLGNPFPLYFRNREMAWDYWQRNKDKLLGIAERKPVSQEFAAKAVPERIDRVETETQARMESSPSYPTKADAPPLPKKEYLCIVADPPWKYDLRVEDETHRNRIPYPPMDIEEILALPIPELCSKDGAVLWLWFTNNHMVEAGQCIRHWGFTLKTILTWEKVSQTGNVAIGTGHWLRNATEHCALAVKGNVPSFRHTGTLTNQSNVIRAPRREHSRKPDEFYHLVEQLCPNSSKLELFARQQREGWESWGNETDLFSA